MKVFIGIILKVWDQEKRSHYRGGLFIEMVLIAGSTYVLAAILDSNMASFRTILCFLNLKYTKKY